MGRLREIPRCPICGSTSREVVYPASPALTEPEAMHNPYRAHYQINRCPTCALIFSSPIFDDELVGRLYSQASVGNVSPGERDNVRRTMARYYGLARDHLPGRRRILDVGCDRGIMLEIAGQDGFAELHGVEPNPVARREAMKLEGAVITAQFYENTDYPTSSFDLITLVHVLDHLVDPRTVLRRATRDLRVGGIVLAVVHDVESLLARLFGERFPIYNLYHHYFFSQRTLRRLFESVGYETVFVGTTVNCYSIGYLAARLPGIPAAVSSWLSRGLTAIGIGALPVTIRLGNIGIVARWRP